jgi:hypothetical protein
MSWSSLENNPEDKMEIIEETLDEVSMFLLTEAITDDNPSCQNGLTSLEQILLFELGEFIDDKITLEYLTDKVYILARELEIEEEELFWEEEADTDTYNTDDILDGLSTGERVDFSSEFTKERIKAIAYATSVSLITKDNVSPTNQSNSLEQLIYFTLREYIIEDEDFEKYLDLVYKRSLILQGGSYSLRDLERDISLDREYKKIKF